MKKTFLIMAFLLPAIAGIVLGFRSKPVPSSGPLVTKNFVYIAYPDDDPSKINNPANYSLTASNGTAPLNCPNGAHRCGVIAVDDGTGHPDLNQSFIPKTKP